MSPHISNHPEIQIQLKTPIKKIFPERFQTGGRTGPPITIRNLI